jgi:hypothetical protein
LILLYLRSRHGGISKPAKFLLAFLFGGAYNFFFLYDISTSGLSFQSLLTRELPVIFVMAAFYLLSSSSVKSLHVTWSWVLVSGVAVTALVALLLARNILVAGSITSNLPVFNTSWREALALLAQAGRPSVAPTNLAQLFQWNTLFDDMQIGGLFLIPVAVGLVVVILGLFRHDGNGANRMVPFVFISTFLSLLLLWSWTFGSSFQGPEVRRLYYFAPFMAVLGGMGLVSIADRLKFESSTLRISLFMSASVAYFWYQEVGVSWTVSQISSALGRLGGPTIVLVVPLLAIFAVCFYPLGGSADIHGSTPGHGRTTYAKVASITLVILLASMVAYNSASIAASSPQTNNLAPKGWENGLTDVTTYLNSYQNNTYSILATYALPLAYFTPHPVIESTTNFGLSDLLAMNDSDPSLATELLNGGVHYLLLPRQGNNFYNFSTMLARNFSALDQNLIDQAPNFVLVQNFDKYSLYKVVAESNLTSAYSYLTDFRSSWTPLNPSSHLASTGSGVSLEGGYLNDLSVGGSNPAGFWIPAKASSSDTITTSNDMSRTAGGNESLKISLRGTGNMVIDHYYTSPQNWSNYSALSMYFYGANTSKSVSLTFHTNGWKDYFAVAFVDNFVGWKQLRFPLDSFVRYGAPSWGNISFIEFLMGDRTGTYWIDGLSLGGTTLGFEGSMPPIPESGWYGYVVVSYSQVNATSSFAPILDLSCANATRSFALSTGVNILEVPSWYLTGGSTIKLVEPSLAASATSTFYYLGVLAGPSGS